MEQMTFLDFFAGIGGFRKGFELCGMRCVGHCEIDKYADRSYRAIHDVKEDEWYAADITKVAPADLPRADVCQISSQRSKSNIVLSRFRYLLCRIASIVLIRAARRAGT